MNAKQKIRRELVFGLLAVTRFLERADFHVPVKWYAILDSLRVSSGILHDRIGFIDPEVEEQFRELEKRIDIRLGKKKPYSEEDIERINRRAKKIEV